MGGERSIEGGWSYLWIDATYLKVHQEGCIVSVAVIVTADVNADDRYEVLGRDRGRSMPRPRIKSGKNSSGYWSSASWLGEACADQYSISRCL